MSARRGSGRCPSCGWKEGEKKAHMRKSRLHKGYGDCAECWVDHLHRSGELIKEIRRSDEDFRRWKDYIRYAGKFQSKEGFRRWKDASRTSSDSVASDETVCTTDAVCLSGVSVSSDNNDDVSAASTLDASRISGTEVTAKMLVAIRRGN